MGLQGAWGKGGRGEVQDIRAEGLRSSGWRECRGFRGLEA